MIYVFNQIILFLVKQIHDTKQLPILLAFPAHRKNRYMKELIGKKVKDHIVILRRKCYIETG